MVAREKGLARACKGRPNGLAEGRLRRGWSIGAPRCSPPRAVALCVGPALLAAAAQSEPWRTHLQRRLHVRVVEVQTGERAAASRYAAATL